MERMGALSNNLKAVVELQASKGTDPQQPLFQSLSSVHFGMYMYLYCTEICGHLIMVGNISLSH